MIGKTTKRLSDGQPCSNAQINQTVNKDIEALKKELYETNLKVDQNTKDIANPDIKKETGSIDNLASKEITTGILKSGLVSAAQVNTDNINIKNSDTLIIEHPYVDAKHINAESIDVTNLNATNATVSANMDFNNVKAKNIDTDVIDAAVVDVDDLRVLNKVPDLSTGMFNTDDAHITNETVGESLITTLTAVGAHIDELAANNVNATNTTTDIVNATTANIDEAMIDTLWTAGFRGTKSLTLDTTLPISDVITFKIPVVTGTYMIRNEDFSISVFMNNSKVKYGDLKPAIFYQLTQSVVGVISEVRYCAKDNYLYIYYKRQEELRDTVDYSVITTNTADSIDLTFDINNFKPEVSFTTYPDAINYVAFINKPEDMAFLVQGRFKAAATEIGNDELFLKSVYLKEKLAFQNNITGGYDTVIMGEYDSDKKEPVARLSNGTGLRVEGSTSLGKGLTVEGDTYLNGNIYQNGETYETHAQQVYTKDSMIITRDGAETALGPSELTGIKAHHYDEEGNDGVLAFDKNGEARVGDVGQEQPIATRSELNEMENASVVSWNAAEKKLVTSREPLIFGSRIAKTEDALMLTGAEGMDNLPTEYTSIDQVVKCGQYAASSKTSEKYIGKPKGESGAFDLTVGYFNTEKNKPYQVYVGKNSNKVYYRLTNGEDTAGTWTEWKELATADNIPITEYKYFASIYPAALEGKNKKYYKFYEISLANPVGLGMPSLDISGYIGSMGSTSKAHFQLHGDGRLGKDTGLLRGSIDNRDIGGANIFVTIEKDSSGKDKVCYYFQDSILSYEAIEIYSKYPLKVNKKGIDELPVKPYLDLWSQLYNGNVGVIDAPVVVANDVKTQDGRLIATTDNIKNLQNNSFILSNDNAQKIASNTDVNNIGVGTWYTEYDDIARSLKHSPFTITFRMIVMQVGGQVRQIAYSQNGLAPKYRDIVLNATDDVEWKEIATTDGTVNINVKQDLNTTFDLNSFYTDELMGSYGVYKNPPKNYPSEAGLYGRIDCIRYTNGSKDTVQVVTSFDKNKIFIRSINESSQKPWKEIATTDNVLNINKDTMAEIAGGTDLVTLKAGAYFSYQSDYEKIKNMPPKRDGYEIWKFGSSPTSYGYIAYGRVNNIIYYATFFGAADTTINWKELATTDGTINTTFSNIKSLEKGDILSLNTGTYLSSYGAYPSLTNTPPEPAAYCYWKFETDDETSRVIAFARDINKIWTNTQIFYSKEWTGWKQITTTDMSSTYYGTAMKDIGCSGEVLVKDFIEKLKANFPNLKSGDKVSFRWENAAKGFLIDGKGNQIELNGGCLSVETLGNPKNAWNFGTFIYTSKDSEAYSIGFFTSDGVNIEQYIKKLSTAFSYENGTLNITH